MVKMKPFIYVSTLFSISFSVSNAWISDGGSTFCDKTKLMKLRDDVKGCNQLAYQNFLEEKLSNVEEFKARCDYLDYQVGYFDIQSKEIILKCIFLRCRKVMIS